jgi:hypothetical protein
MAFSWPTKKETPESVRAKPDFPSDLDLPGATASTAASQPASRPSGTAGPLKARPLDAPSPSDADALASLTERLENLGKLVDQAKEQVTSYLLHRESQSSGEDSAEMSRRFDILAEKLEQLSGGSGRQLEQKLDALYGKIDTLSRGAMSSGSSGSSDASAPAASEAALQGAVRPVSEKIEQIEAKLKVIDSLKEALVSHLTKLRDSQTEQHGALTTGVRQISEMLPQYFGALPQYFGALQQQILGAQQHADAGLRTIIDILRPPQQESSEPAVGGDWQEAILGHDLATGAAANQERQQLLRGVLTSDPGASALVGNIMLFRAAPAEKMPPLLKEIGEAFYRWQPRSSNRPSEFEKALVAWLERSCDQAGMANKIELVSPGERFDSLRHNATKPGVEITQVLGWIVLRDNGKVYTKASVAVK